METKVSGDSYGSSSKLRLAFDKVCAFSSDEKFSGGGNYALFTLDLRGWHDLHVQQMFANLVICLLEPLVFGWRGVLVSLPSLFMHCLKWPLRWGDRLLDQAGMLHPGMAHNMGPPSKGELPLGSKIHR